MKPCPFGCAEPPRVIDRIATKKEDDGSLVYRFNVQCANERTPHVVLAFGRTAEEAMEAWESGPREADWLVAAIAACNQMAALYQSCGAEAMTDEQEAFHSDCTTAIDSAVCRERGEAAIMCRERIKGLSAGAADGDGCRCGYCVPPDQVHYSREYCKVVKSLPAGWWERASKHLMGLGEFAALNPLRNGSTVACAYCRRHLSAGEITPGALPVEHQDTRLGHDCSITCAWPDGPFCKSRWGRWNCTKAPGHAPPHMACDGDAITHAEWLDEHAPTVPARDELARRALENCRRPVDVNEWAGRLAADAVAAGEDHLPKPTPSAPAQPEALECGCIFGDFHSCGRPVPSAPAPKKRTVVTGNTSLARDIKALLDMEAPSFATAPIVGPHPAVPEAPANHPAVPDSSREAPACGTVGDITCGKCRRDPCVCKRAPACGTCGGKRKVCNRICGHLPDNCCCLTDSCDMGPRPPCPECAAPPAAPEPAARLGDAAGFAAADAERCIKEAEERGFKRGRNSMKVDAMLVAKPFSERAYYAIAVLKVEDINDATKGGDRHE